MSSGAGSELSVSGIQSTFELGASDPEQQLQLKPCSSLLFQVEHSRVWSVILNVKRMPCTDKPVSKETCAYAYISKKHHHSQIEDCQKQGDVCVN
jgi:hypothetical protein